MCQGIQGCGREGKSRAILTRVTDLSERELVGSIRRVYLTLCVVKPGTASQTYVVFLQYEKYTSFEEIVRRKYR